MIKKTLFSSVKLKTLTILAGGALALGTPVGIGYAHGNHGDQGNRSQVNHRDNRGFDNRGGPQATLADRRNDNSDKKNNPDPAVCDQRQTAVNQQIESFKATEQAKLQKVNAYLANQQAFVSQNGLTVNGYDQLNQKATEVQTAFANAINNLSAPTIDCNTSQNRDDVLVAQATRDTRISGWMYVTSVARLSWAVLNS